MQYNIGTLFISLFLCLFISCNTGTRSTTYYFSNSGDDNNTGVSKNNAWKNLNKLDTITLNPGDKIFLKCGDLFTGTINISFSGTNQHPITISSYGDGKKPVLKGSIAIKKYKTHNDSLISFQSKKSIKNVLLNNTFLIPARYPNKGYLRIDKAEDKIGVLQDNDITLNEDGYWANARIVFRSTDWTYDWDTINTFKNNTFYYDTIDLRYSVRKNYGYFLDHKAELLDTAGEYYYNAEENKCLLYPTDKNNLNIDAITLDYGIYLPDRVSNIKIKNIHFNQYHKAGIYGEANNKNIHITGCKFTNTNETGIRFKSNALSCKVENCSFYNIMGRGISFTNSRNNTISNNIVKKIGLIPGLGLHGVNGMTGILVEARDETRNRIFDIENFQSDSNYIGLNKVDSCGYTGIRVDGKHNLIEKNIINHAMLQLSDGGALYSFRHTSNSTFRNNFVFNSIGNNESTAKTHHLIALGIYMDGSTNCKVYNNTVYNNTTGLVLNAGSKNHECIGNVLYGNTRNQITLPTPKKPTDENHVIKNNTLFCTDSNQYCIIQMFKIKDTTFGTFDNNIYCDPYSNHIIKRIWEIQDSLTLEEWQQISNQDMNSSTCELYDPNQFDHKLFHNQSNKNTTIQLNIPYYDLNGNKLTQLELNPYSSKVLIFKTK